MSEPLATAGTIEMRDRTPVAIRADNLIRQRLRIGDPRNPLEVAEGLKRLFPKDAGALLSEADGLAPLPSRLKPSPLRAPESAATGSELTQAIADVERDLAALTADHRLKGITAELQGWGQAIRSIVADGAAAARLALDPRARDRLFAARRQLGDYARLARMIGALTQTMTVSYRRLAQSLDQVASLILVLAGEVLAGAGVGGGRFLLSVPASELQARRDAVLLALRNLAGTTDQAYGNDQWPWGLHGFREMLRAIEVSGHLDLRALLEEPTLGKLMDELIERAAQHNVVGLRALGATAEVAVERVHRLIHIIHDRVQPEVPAVTTFLKSLQLLLDAFTASRSGYRLLFVARPPIGLAGASAFGGPDTATRRLIDLVIERGRLAELLDCHGCDCCDEDVICQILLDKLLYDTDRAIDLYTLGSDENGDEEPEWRAVAFGLLIHQFLAGGASRTEPGTQDARACLDGSCSQCAPQVGESLARVRNLLFAEKLDLATPLPLPADVDPLRPLLTHELCMQRISDQRLESLIATLAPGCVRGSRVLAELSGLIQSTILAIDANHAGCADPEVAPPPSKESSLRIFYRPPTRQPNDVFGMTVPRLRFD